MSSALSSGDKAERPFARDGPTAQYLLKRGRRLFAPATKELLQLPAPGAVASLNGARCPACRSELLRYALRTSGEAGGSVKSDRLVERLTSRLRLTGAADATIESLVASAAAIADAFTTATVAPAEPKE